MRRILREDSDEASTDSVDKDLVEHLFTNTVKRKMARVKTVMGWVIPVLWLAASIECLSDLVNRVPHKPNGSAFSSHQCSHRESSTPVCSLEQSARRLVRRLDFPSGPAGLYTHVALSECRYPLSAQPEFSSARLQPTLELTKSWQFLWRTAVEPRAPSSVS